jgi:hypothetical protein
MYHLNAVQQNLVKTKPAPNAPSMLGHLNQGAGLIRAGLTRHSCLWVVKPTYSLLLYGPGSATSSLHERYRLQEGA